jgi:hypothetical protein
MAVQVDPIQPKLKPPGMKRLKLTCDILLSNFAFKSNLRRYTEALRDANARLLREVGPTTCCLKP